MAEENETVKKPTAAQPQAAPTTTEPKAPEGRPGEEERRPSGGRSGEEDRKSSGPHSKEGPERAPKEHRAGHEKETAKEGRALQEKEAAKEAAKAAKPALKKKPPAGKAPKVKAAGKADIGIDVRPPARTCSDQNCPFHGRLPVRGQVFEGVVVADGMDKSAVIRRERLVYVPKYERYLKRTSRMSVHSPPCIAARAGDRVTVMECRPLSKTIAFTIVSKRAEGKAKAE